MRKWFKRPYFIIAAMLVLAIVTPVLASGIMQKKPTTSTAAVDHVSRVTAQPLTNTTNATTVQTPQKDQSRVTMTPLDKTLDQVKAQTSNQQPVAPTHRANTASGSSQSVPPPSNQSAGSTDSAVQQNSPQQQGHQLSESSIAQLKQQGLSEGQIKKINEIISLGITEDQLAKLLNEKGYANIAAALAHQRNEVRKTDKGEKKEKNHEDKHHKVKHQKHGDEGDD
ncbi:hypothetical protein PP175_19800 [Aneurinibacillus sp. Ricciae_BoGa-3]|uniref:hypothetical protein n=1 Tax=Aneurinibacillus sp. Ricciae_BoGa-3 TaxID=3022697 RepID=UPI00234029A1|nr:hypothetical protein [Aneurinibacillus sp. Ricciae_BoGa-3]WCK53557.1 hypothetical protein PP175_19800 [Aneurinibacillus sp. Ricciae_BoGa-3]